MPGQARHFSTARAVLIGRLVSVVVSSSRSTCGQDLHQAHIALDSFSLNKIDGFTPAIFIHLGFSSAILRCDFVRGEKRRFARDRRKVVYPYHLNSARNASPRRNVPGRSTMAFMPKITPASRSSRRYLATLLNAPRPPPAPPLP